MTLSLIATPGAANANAYCTVAEADTYHESHLYATDWTGASSDDKTAALVMATRLIDQHMKWIGYPVSSSQALQWPRNFVYTPDSILVDSSSIPSFVRDATAELARILIGQNRTSENKTKGFREVQIGTLRVKIDAADRIGTIPDSVWMFVKDYASRKSSKTRTLLLG